MKQKGRFGENTYQKLSGLEWALLELLWVWLSLWVWLLLGVVQQSGDWTWCKLL